MSSSVPSIFVDLYSLSIINFAGEIESLKTLEILSAIKLKASICDHSHQ